MTTKLRFGIDENGQIKNTFEISSKNISIQFDQSPKIDKKDIQTMFFDFNLGGNRSGS